jgi:hypothetical protein
MFPNRIVRIHLNAGSGSGTGNAGPKSGVRIALKKLLKMVIFKLSFLGLLKKNTKMKVYIL